MTANWINTIEGSAITIRVQDQANASVYADFAMITAEKSISKNLNEFTEEVPDLNDLGGVAKTKRRITSKDLSISGSGLVHSNAVADAHTWVDSAQARTVRINDTISNTVAECYLVQFDVSASRTEFAKCSITLKPKDGWTTT